MVKSSKDDLNLWVQDLRKVYVVGGGKNKVAIKNITFGLKKGECLSILGINGAGKTTIFKMLTGEINPTYGSAAICGYEIPK